MNAPPELGNASTLLVRPVIRRDAYPMELPDNIPVFVKDASKFNVVGVLSAIYKLKQF